MNEFLIFVAPFLIIIVSLIFVFWWAVRDKDAS
ncbi:cytochrome bd oxidase small subunit CydS [Gracilibacillus caseinilyticus]